LKILQLAEPASVKISLDLAGVLPLAPLPDIAEHFGRFLGSHRLASAENPDALILLQG
jgi:hypothetical protein